MTDACKLQINHVLLFQLSDGESEVGVGERLVDVFLLEEHALVEVGIEIGLHQSVGHIGSPADEMVNSLLWTLGIKDLQTVALCFHLVAHGAQAVGCHLGEQCCGFKMAIDALAHN